MAGSVNKVILVGNLGKDPEIRRTQDGRPIANLSIATSETWRDKGTGERKEKTEWHRVVIFNEGLCKVAEQYLKKGAKVYIEGALQTRKWTDQSGVEKYSTEAVLQGFNSTLTMLHGNRAGAVGLRARRGAVGSPQGHAAAPGDRRHLGRPDDRRCDQFVLDPPAPAGRPLEPDPPAVDLHLGDAAARGLEGAHASGGQPSPHHDLSVFRRAGDRRPVHALARTDHACGAVRHLKGSHFQPFSTPIAVSSSRPAEAGSTGPPITLKKVA